MSYNYDDAVENNLNNLQDENQEVNNNQQNISIEESMADNVQNSNANNFQCGKPWHKCYCYCKPICPPRQRHVHEFLGSTKLAETGNERHNHRFAGVTSQAIPSGNSHIHKIYVNTDYFGHFHVICVITGPAIDVGNGKHVHLVTGFTSINDNHRHDFIFTTLIEDPLK